MVNIKQVDPTPILEKFKDRDMLEAIFELIGTQNNTWQHLNLETREGQRGWKEILFCLTEELYEAANVLKSRPWVQTEYQLDWDHLYDELADALWFFVALLQASGLDAKKTFEILVRKYLVNDFRRRSKY